MSSSNLEELAVTPCTRCFICEFTPQVECQNPYKECSTCSIVRLLDKDFSQAETKARTDAIEEAKQVVIDADRLYTTETERKVANDYKEQIVAGLTSLLKEKQ